MTSLSPSPWAPPPFALFGTLSCQSRASSSLDPSLEIPLEPDLPEFLWSLNQFLYHTQHVSLNLPFFSFACTGFLAGRDPVRSPKPLFDGGRRETPSAEPQE